MPKMDLKCLTKMLCATPERKPRYSNEDDVIAESTHLLYDVVLPLMGNQPVYLSTLNFNAFDLDDIRCTSYFAQYRDESVPLVCNLLEHISQVNPKTAAARVFC